MMELYCPYGQGLSGARDDGDVTGFFEVVLVVTSSVEKDLGFNDNVRLFDISKTMILKVGVLALHEHKARHSARPLRPYPATRVIGFGSRRKRTEHGYG